MRHARQRHDLNFRSGRLPFTIAKNPADYPSQVIVRQSNIKMHLSLITLAV